MEILRYSCLFFLLSKSVKAFLSPNSFVLRRATVCGNALRPSASDAKTLFLPRGKHQLHLMNDNPGTSLLIADLGDTLRTVGIGLTFVIFFLAGVTYLYASYIIPQAAKQLEIEAKELAPELWEEYESKLNEGEDISMRPELMQELGEKIQPLIEKKYSQQGGEVKTQQSSVEVTQTKQSGGESPPQKPAAIDAEIIDKD